MKRIHFYGKKRSKNLAFSLVLSTVLLAHSLDVSAQANGVAMASAQQQTPQSESSSGFNQGGMQIGNVNNITVRLPARIPSECVVNAAQRYQVPEMALLAILKQESGGRTGVIATNSNGSKDYGPAQFNDRSWGAYMTNKYGITLNDLTYNMCQAIMAQAYAVRSLWNTCISKGNPSIWCAIAHYNSPTPKYQEIYVRNVWSRYQEMVAKGRFE